MSVPRPLGVMPRFESGLSVWFSRVIDGQAGIQQANRQVMIMKKQLTACLMAGAVALGACAQDTTDGTDTTSSPGTVSNTSTTLSGADATSGDNETIVELQTEIDALASAIAESDAAEELGAGWDTLRTELATALVSIQEDGTVAREEIEDRLESFEQRIDELEVEENVRTSWDALRSHLEQLLD